MVAVQLYVEEGPAHRLQTGACGAVLTRGSPRDFHRCYEGVTPVRPLTAKVTGLIVL
ncbi:hypothetical protein GCM10010532_043670 [Dactylosporangium siamense]|uniref:Uncharacterized protein n=1 Tax=Dactylosporangium siamense TaxID=685454 RepID=A0A919PI06_9ACTN|nr:hypothetical protein Dsi01nite_032220 [Dactylosporangium siamense]